jgi:hypothetical protein
MASFVEQATLKVNDQSSAAIKKINAELKKLDQTARSLKSTTINLRVNTNGLQAANKQLNTLAHNMSTLRGQTLTLRVNSAGLAQAQSQLNRLRQQATRPINVNTRGVGGAGAGAGAGAGRRGLRQTGIQYQMGNFSALRGAASVLIGGTAYAVASNVARNAVEGVVGSEDARTRLRQSGFDKGRTDQLTPQTDFIMAMARKSQEEFQRIPAAEIANASVEQLNALKAAGKSTAEYQAAMNRIARNAQIMGMTFKDPKAGAEGSRQLERVSQIMGQDIDDTKIKAIQEAAMRAIIATGGEIKPEEAVRALQQLGSTVTKSLSPKGLTDLLLVRDEGGRQSTAEFRTAIQDLQKGSLNKGDKAAQAALGLRKKGGLSDPAVVKAAASDLVGFTKDRIIPLLEKAGVDQSSSAAVGTWLDEHGFTTSGARAFADIVTSLKSGEFQRQQAAAANVDLDPHLGDRTFRGGTERMSASFQTAMARALDKSGGAFTDAIAPFSIAMDKAGKEAEKSNYAGAALEMTKGVAQMMGGPAGAIITAMTTANAARTLLDPTSTQMEKGAAMLVTGSSALLTAAGAMMNYFGGGDPNTDLAHLQQLDKSGPAAMESLQKQKAAAEAAVAADPTVRNRQKLANINRAIEGAENQQRDVERQIPLAQARVDALKKEQADLKAQEAAEMEKLRQAAGLDPVTGQPTVAPSATGPISAETLTALQQLNTGGGLAGVKSITDLLKALNQPTSVASREALAKQLGYTGPSGGTAAMNTFLLDFFKKLATTPPSPPPPTVAPPPPPTVAPPPEAPIFTAPRPFSELIDVDTAKTQFASFFSDGATTIGQSGTAVGSNAASELGGQASSIGTVIGNAAAARISQATINFNIPNMPAPKPNTGELRSA